MRVLFINAVCGNGSTGRIVTDLCDILKNKGNQVKVIYGLGEATRIDKKDTVRVSNKIDYYIHNGLSRLSDRAGFYSHYSTRKMISEIKEFNPDIINLHNLHGYYVNIRMLFKFLSDYNVPVVWTLHDCWAMTGHCAHFDYIKCNKWETQCYDCPQIFSYPKSYFVDKSKKNYEDKKRLFTGIKDMTIITPSQWLGNIVNKSFLNKYPVKVINNGIDLSIFRPCKSNFKLENNIVEKKMILAVANDWNSKKGLTDVFNLSNIIDKNKFKIVVVGLTDKQLDTIPSNIIGISRTSSLDKLVEIYSAADVFINTTYEDTYPTVNIEALACGTPIVTYNTGGSPEIIDDTCGIVVEQGNIYSLKKAIETIAFCKEKIKYNCLERARHNEKKLSYKKYYDLFVEKANLL